MLMNLPTQFHSKIKHLLLLFMSKLSPEPLLWVYNPSPPPLMGLATCTKENLTNFRSCIFKETFKECRKNHASIIGGNALDGCKLLLVGTEIT
ncbi:zinc-finger homeodomain protein [Trifolium repens]|nr:zinc-finger homeodomain protein [Trifolium repens]